MIKKPVISIIVPVYNLEKYITKCIGSLLSQGLEENDYEIILVDDGSTDNSLQLCQSYVQRYSSITVYSQPNQGPGVARNRGLNTARGEYVYMIDGDDYLVPEALGFICKAVIRKRECDVIVFNYKDILKEEVGREPLNEKIAYEGEAFTWMLESKMIGHNVWRAVYRKDFLDRHNLRFKHYIMNEDFLFSISALLFNPRVVHLSGCFYRYVVHPGSICTTKAKQHKRKCLEHYFCSLVDICGLLENHRIKEFYPELHQLFAQKINLWTFEQYKIILRSDYSVAEYKEVINRFVSRQFLPMRSVQGIFKYRFICRMINVLTRVPVLYKPICFLYNKGILNCFFVSK